MDAPLILVVTLWVDPACVDAFIAYERQAARVMARYGGRIDRVIRNQIVPPDGTQPFEIHVVRFPDAAAFDGYRADPEMKSLSATRSEVILRTSIVVGRDVDVYE